MSDPRTREALRADIEALFAARKGWVDPAADLLREALALLASLPVQADAEATYGNGTCGRCGHLSSEHGLDRGGADWEGCYHCECDSFKMPEAALRAKLEATERECDKLRDWKGSAMRVLSKWHRLGAALQLRYPIKLGDDIPTALLEAISSSPASPQQEGQ